MGAGAGGLSAEQIDRMASEGVVFAESKSSSHTLAASLKQFARMRKVGVPINGILQQLSLREDISAEMVQDFLAWCEARRDGISRDDILAAFPTVRSDIDDGRRGAGSKSNVASGDESSEGADLQLLHRTFAHDPTMISKFDKEKQHLLAAAIRTGGSTNMHLHLTENYASDLMGELMEARQNPGGFTADEAEAMCLHWLSAQEDPTCRVVGEYLMHAMVSPMRKQERRARRREDREYELRGNADAEVAALAATKVGGR